VVAFAGLSTVPIPIWHTANKCVVDNEESLQKAIMKTISSHPFFYNEDSPPLSLSLMTPLISSLFPLKLYLLSYIFSL